MLTAIVLVLLAWVLVSAAIAVPIGRTIARCATPDPDACPCPDPTCDGSAYDAAGRPRKAGEWVAESRGRGGRA